MNAKVLEMLENLADGFFVLDENAAFIYVNHQAEGILSKSKEDLIGKNIWDSLPFLTHTSLYTEYVRAFQEQSPQTTEYFCSQRNHWYEVKIYPDRGGCSVYLKNVTHEKKAQVQDIKKQGRFKNIFESSALGIGVANLEGIPVECNQALLHMLGYTLEELKATSFQYITHPDDVEEDGILFKKLINKEILNYQIKKRYIRKNGEIIWAKLSVTPLFDENGNIEFVMSTMENITEMKGIEERQAALLEKWQKLSSTDSLTQVNNRRAFDHLMEAEWERCLKENTPLSLILLDIDRFKSYNDTYGHYLGDKCLKKIAQSIQAVVQEDRFHLCRYGGEEFGVILSNTTEEEAQDIAEKLRSHIEQLQIQHVSAKHSNYVTASLGVATVLPQSSSTFMEIVMKADQALYEAKKLGRNQVKLYHRD